MGRYPLRTPYPSIVNDVAKLMRDPALYPTEYAPQREHYATKPAILIVDSTGVGVAVSDLLKGRSLNVKSVIIAGGDNAYGGGKIACPQGTLWQRLRCRFTPKLWPVMKKGLLSFKRKIDLKAAHDSFTNTGMLPAWRVFMSIVQHFPEHLEAIV